MRRGLGAGGCCASSVSTATLRLQDEPAEWLPDHVILAGIEQVDGDAAPEFYRARLATPSVRRL
jgi:hypothetical protein